MINFDDVTKKTIKKLNSNWPKFFDHPYRILIIRRLKMWKNKFII